MLTPRRVSQDTIDVDDDAGTRVQGSLAPIPVFLGVRGRHTLSKGKRRAMSARLDAMGATERHTLPIPYGHHVFVVSDLSLSSQTSTRSRPLVELTTLLGDI